MVRSAISQQVYGFGLSVFESFLDSSKSVGRAMTDEVTDPAPGRPKILFVDFDKRRSP